MTPFPEPDAILASGSHPLHFYLGDCVEILGRLPAGSVDVVVTSPPYNLGVRYRTHDDRLPREDYLAWTSTWIGAVARVLAPDGSLFLNVGTKPSDAWLPFDVALAARPHLVLQNTIHWIKSIARRQAWPPDSSAAWPSVTTSRSTAPAS